MKTNKTRRMMREDTNEGDLLYDVFSSCKDEDGNSIVDLGNIPHPSTTYINDDLQASIATKAEKVARELLSIDETLFDALPIEEHSYAWEEIDKAMSTILCELVGLYHSIDMGMVWDTFQEGSKRRPLRQKKRER